MIMKKTIMTSILITAIAALMIPSAAMAGGGGIGLTTNIGEIKPGTPFEPVPSGNGRGVAFDGTNILYYTLFPNVNIYQVTTAGVSLGPILLGTDRVQCGALEFDTTTGLLYCGSYDGAGDVYSIDVTTGDATLLFNQAAFGGIADDSCYGGGVAPFIDGLARDSDGSFWLSGDAAKTIYHVTAVGAFIDSFTVPDHPNTGVTGCSTGIDIAPGGFLELAMQAGPDLGPHVVVKVLKVDNVDNPVPIVTFQTLASDDPGVEGVSYDGKTFAPLCALWTNQFAGPPNLLTAFDVQCTRTIGYWKNHPTDADLTPPIILGDGTDTKICQIVDTPAEVETVLKAHKGSDAGPKLKAQLLAAKLNIELGDVPIADQQAIAQTIIAADKLLAKDGCDPDTGKRGADRAEAQALHALLDAFNNKYSP